MRDQPTAMFRLPRPGRGLLGVMGVLLFIWVALAVGINFAGLDLTPLLVLAGNTAAIRHGEVWRLFTAGLVHMPFGSGAVTHILFVLMGLYFMGPPLESRWGTRRFVIFLFASCTLAYAVQFLAELLLPGSMARAIAAENYFGFFPAVQALVVAWALTYRDQSMFLFFFPVSARALLWITGAYNVAMIITHNLPAEGGMAPFGGMLAGFLLGSGSPSPVRRLWLQIRYRWLQTRAERQRRSRGSKAAPPWLRVIDGEKPDPNLGDKPRRRPPTDKRFLN